MNNKLKRFFSQVAKKIFTVLIYHTAFYVISKKNILARKGFKILAYHRINDTIDAPKGMCVSIANFEKQLQWLRDNFTLVSLYEAIGLLNNRQKNFNNVLVITFDDGYKDNYTNAFPLLKKYGIPVTIFLSTGLIDSNKSLWFDTIYYAFKLTSKNEVDLKEFSFGKYYFSSKSAKLRTADKITLQVKKMNSQRCRYFINYLLNALDVREEETISMGRLLSWSEVSEMAKAGVTFGSHGINHFILSRFSEQEQDYEIRESKKAIKEKTGIDVRIFSFPNGRTQDFTEKTKDFLKRNGYIASCSLINGFNNSKTDIYSLKRLCVTATTGVNLFNRFDKYLFDAEINYF